MSKTQTHSLNRHVCYLSIAGALLLLAFAFASVRPTPPPETLTIKVIPYSPQPRRVQQVAMPSVFDSEVSYYKTIIENNLFRPLGWQPTPPVEPYRLIGTIFARDANTPPEAIIESTTEHQTHIVKLGDKLDAETEIVEIQPKQVTLSSKGQQRSLFLNAALWIQ